MLERRTRPSGADRVRLARVIDAGMAIEVPVGKADGLCCPDEIHGRRHPLELMMELI
jgi:hypothetical protein